MMTSAFVSPANAPRNCTPVAGARIRKQAAVSRSVCSEKCPAARSSGERSSSTPGRVSRSMGVSSRRFYGRGISGRDRARAPHRRRNLRSPARPSVARGTFFSTSASSRARGVMDDKTLPGRLVRR